MHFLKTKLTSSRIFVQKLIGTVVDQNKIGQSKFRYFCEIHLLGNKSVKNKKNNSDRLRPLIECIFLNILR
jgi:hypothetical protein